MLFAPAANTGRLSQMSRRAVCRFPGGARAALCLLRLFGTRSRRTAVALDTLRRWEMGRLKHAAAIAGALEAQCPLNHNCPVRAGAGAGSAVLEESPSGTRHSPSPGSPGPIGPGQRCLVSPLLLCYPWSAKKCIAMFGAALSAGPGSEARGDAVPRCAGGRRRQEPAGPSGSVGQSAVGLRHPSGLSVQPENTLNQHTAARVAWVSPNLLQGLVPPGPAGPPGLLWRASRDRVLCPKGPPRLPFSSSPPACRLQQLYKWEN